MLPIYQSFLLKHGVRNLMQLMSPKVAPIEDIVLPRGSTYHYLDLDSDAMFPTPEGVYMHGVVPMKKIPIYHVPRLDSTKGNPLVTDKQTPREIRKWTLANIKRFRALPLPTMSTSENLTIPIVNYNVVKHMYRYTANVLSRHYRTYNVFYTLYNTIKKVAGVNNNKPQILEVKIPTSLPSFAVMQRISRLPVIKQSRIVTDVHMKQMLELFTWLDASIRDKTAMDLFKDEDSKYLLIMFSYKGNVVFLPFDIVASLLNTNHLDSRVKLPADKVQKIFLRFLRTIQRKIESVEDNESDVVDNDGVPVNLDKQEESSSSDNEPGEEELVEAPSSPTLTEYSGKKPEYKTTEVLDGPASLTVNETEESIAKSMIDSSDDDEGDSVNVGYLADIAKAETTPDITDEEVEEDLVPTEDDFKATDEEISLLLKEDSIEEKNLKDFQALTASKLISSSEASSNRKLIAARTKLKSPYDPKVHIDEYKQVSEEAIKIKPSNRQLSIENDLIDDSLKYSSLNNMDKAYIRDVLPKDVAACVTHIEKAGFIIKEYTVEPSSTAMGNYETHHLTIKPIKGKEASLYFRLPKVNSEGNFTAAGIKYKMKKQRADLPIRKVAPAIVKLSSYYGKLFISTTERKAYDTLAYITDYIKDLYFVEVKDPSSKLTSVTLGNVYKNTYHIPVILQSLSKSFSSIVVNDITFLFDQEALHEYLDEKIIKDLKDHGFYFCGYTKAKKPVVCDYTDTFYVYNKKDDVDNLGSMVELLGIDHKKLPVSYTDIKILGKDLPLGVALGYFLGLKNLIKVLKPTMKIMENNKRYELLQDEWQIRFFDYRLVFTRKEKEATFILAGFNFFKDFIKQYNLKDFDTKNVYMNLVEERDFGIWHLKELEILKDLFLDPITIDQLKLMKEPTEFIPLLLRANSMLTDYSHPDINDTRYVRIKGYERVPGIVYKSLAMSVRAHKLKTSSKGKPELSPYEVWNNITQDTSVKIVEDINPVMNLKEMEAVTLGGNDGIGKEMVASKLREYSPYDMGLMSESSGDGSDVGNNTFLSTDAKFANIRGNVDLNNDDHVRDPKKLLSTTAMLSVGANYDDPKRCNFSSILAAQTIFTEGYTQASFRTEYEYIMPYRVGSLYCAMASDSGTVTELTSKMITVTYKNGETLCVPIGLRFGSAEGTTYPNTIVSPLSKGEKFSKGACIAYNSGFFEPDWLDKKTIIYKSQMLCTTAMGETNEVFEDSSAISVDMSAKLRTRTTKVRSFVVNFTQNIVKLLPVGSHLKPEDVLFLITDEDTTESALTDDAIILLKRLSNIAPKAKVIGTLDKIEVLYNGDIADMSPSLRKITNASNADFAASTKGTEAEIKDGAVNHEYRVAGKNLMVDTLELKLYITVGAEAGVGDKVVFGSQMKSVIGDVFSYNVTTESGHKVEAFFSERSLAKRKVISPKLMGTTNRLLKAVSKQIADSYFS